MEATIQALGHRDSLDRDCLLLAIEQSLRVRTRTHFYSWTQGALQGLVPHEVMFCAIFDGHGQIIAGDILCPTPLTEQTRESIIGTDGGLLRLLVNVWEQRGRVPVMVDMKRAAPNTEILLTERLDMLGFGSVAAHGTCATAGGVDSFFGFAPIGAALNEGFADVLEMMTPHLRATLIRARSRRRGAEGGVKRRTLTGREAEILKLLQQGRSNAEIGVTLSISSLTVKNHVQNILRKLGARNRTQAAALDVFQKRGSEA